MDEEKRAKSSDDLAVQSISQEEIDKSEELLVAEALDVAREAFQKYLEDQYYDPGYFDIRFTAWVKDVNFVNRLARVEIERELDERKAD